MDTTPRLRCSAALPRCFLAPVECYDRVRRRDYRTADFAEVGAAAEQYSHKLDPEQVLLVLDIDNTLLAMDTQLGSDQWFEWQKYLIDHEPSSKYLVRRRSMACSMRRGCSMTCRTCTRRNPTCPD